MSIWVLAFNPSIDAEWRVDEVRWEEKNSIRSERRWAGGKGINVARWLRHLGGRPQLLLPLGGQTGTELARYLQAEKIPAKIIPLCEPTRVNVVVTTAAGRQLRFNPAGPKLVSGEWQGVKKALMTNLNRWGERHCEPFSGVKLKLARTLAPPPVGLESRRQDLLILSGSLPRGVPANAYAQLIRLAHRAGLKTLLDCAGEAFAAAVTARPFLVKTNEHELAQWRGHPLRSEAEIIRAARALSAATRGWVLVSRGAKRALLLHRSSQTNVFAQPPRLTPRNSVGAGDAMLAAVAAQLQLGAPPEQWLRCGVAVGCAATQCAAGELPGRKLMGAS